MKRKLLDFPVRQNRELPYRYQLSCLCADGAHECRNLPDAEIKRLMARLQKEFNRALGRVPEMDAG